MKKLFIIVNQDFFFLSHRKDIALQAKKEGFIEYKNKTRMLLPLPKRVKVKL